MKYKSLFLGPEIDGNLKLVGKKSKYLLTVCCVDINGMGYMKDTKGKKNEFMTSVYECFL